MRHVQASVAEHHKAQGLSISAVGAAFLSVLWVEKPITQRSRRNSQSTQRISRNRRSPRS